ncbi:tRNA pseudouridine32 synthase / 23S rRNA pseudouridine746 synthase [Arsukibacterium tuosuense]|uniref:tRNA pseudouridine32 synthase / 23S rRNA pseudouridine746 synthase n=1 Tax=Arsukibacterium tuosuense TaxID=1323745 RepID=A0A285I9G1_9GAMM|nr:pseudouridine synthase [Arsukibacterium tuosuense]SNY43591.1 tRNA pseudouridine32 synthase / 23S rRNA pseudouridine746 synthase [Arsukibacterium tuosuense]
MSTAFNLVAETADFVVLDKAAGVSFHSEDGAGLVVQAEQVLGFKLFAVHRLDKVTSGLIILARSSEVAAQLTSLFTRHQVEKYYLALSLTKPAKKQGWVKGDMAAARRGAWKLLKSQSNPAVSYFVSKGFAGIPIRAFLIKPYSGKTHQIRVALKSVGAAIAGDRLYQGGAADRVYLHAFALSFTLAGKLYQYQQAPEQGTYFQQLTHAGAWQQWAEPWQLTWPDYQQPQSTTATG